MLFSAQHYIAEISKYMTLWPGDVIWLGTDNATLPDLKHGDVCEIVQKDIGVLRNPVARAGAENFRFFALTTRAHLARSRCNTWLK